jgi:hypothetical protein
MISNFAKTLVGGRAAGEDCGNRRFESFQKDEKFE